jgi:predicted 3-demethylubiquinone-9 3-methyltransferase (glyoxalase superfamily)
MEFYKTVFGGKLEMQTYKEFNASQDPSEDNKIMHALLEADNGITIMAADAPNSMEYRPGTNFSVSLSGDNDMERKYAMILGNLGNTRDRFCSGYKTTLPPVKCSSRPFTSRMSPASSWSAPGISMRRTRWR